MTIAALVLIFPLCLAIAAFSDLLTMTIPDAVSILLGAAFVAIALFSGLSAGDMAWHFLASAIIFSVCLGLFAFNIMGGGDAKLLTASSLWFGLTPSLVEYLVTISIMGGLLSILVLGLRWQFASIALSGIPLPKTLTDGNKVPYGVAIGIAGFLAYPASPMLQLAFHISTR